MGEYSDNALTHTTVWCTLVENELVSEKLALDFDTLENLRLNHPAWRLLRAEHAALVASFFDRVFISPNVRTMAQSELAEKLEDELFTLKEQGHKFPKTAQEYLNDWAANDKGWLRKFYSKGSDEPHFDLTPATEKAILWLKTLAERSFVGTESKLLTLFQLLKQIVEGSDPDVEFRLAQLNKRKAEIDLEIEKLQQGNISLLNETALKDRFQQFSVLARELLTDFREVEHNFRILDRSVRERIALHTESKGKLLEEIMGDRDAIADSDQGKSFQAFWSFLMSQSRQNELTELLDKTLTLETIAELQPDPRLRRVHYDWLEAGEHTQQTVRLLSEQLRRFLDDAIWMENRRITELLKSIEAKAIAVRNFPKDDFVMYISLPESEIELPMERRLYTPKIKPKFENRSLELGDEDLDTEALFALTMIDRVEIERHIRKSLQEQSQIGLAQLLELRPLEHGLAELMVYFQLATQTFESVINDEVKETLVIQGADEIARAIELPQVIFVR